MPPPVDGSGARRVQSTMPSGVGSPDAIPSVNGFFASFVSATEMYGEAIVNARYWPVLARKARLCCRFVRDWEDIITCAKPFHQGRGPSVFDL